jgi:small subunit ribosomal protein S11
MLIIISKHKSKTKNIKVGIVHINATFNNTIVTVTDLQGNIISWSSGGSVGFKGARKKTPFAAQIVTEQAIKSALSVSNFGLRKVEVQIKGLGSGRETAMKVLRVLGISILVIRDVTPFPYNGCRQQKRRCL